MNNILPIKDLISRPVSAILTSSFSSSTPIRLSSHTRTSGGSVKIRHFLEADPTVHLLPGRPSSTSCCSSESPVSTPPTDIFRIFHRLTPDPATCVLNMPSQKMVPLFIISHFLPPSSILLLPHSSPQTLIHPSTPPPTLRLLPVTSVELLPSLFPGRR